MPGFPNPTIRKSYGRASTRAAARRSNNMMANSVSNVNGDVVNPAGGGGGGTNAFVGAEIILVSPEAITNITGVVVSWSAMNYDTSSFWSAGSPTILTVPSTGYYQIHVRLSLTGTVTTALYTASSRINGAGAFDYSQVFGVAGGSIELQITYTKLLTAGDTISLLVVFSGTGSGTEAVSLGHMSATLVGT